MDHLSVGGFEENIVIEGPLSAGGGIRSSGNGVFTLVTSKYDMNKGIDQTESVENVSEDISGPSLFGEIANFPQIRPL